MMLKQNLKIFLSYTLLVGLMFSCNKKEFLEENPNTSLVIPATLEDIRSLLDNDRIMSETPVLGELSADNFYLLNNFWQGLNIKEKNAYVWAEDIYQGVTGVGDWDKPYQQVFYANVCLDRLGKIREESNTWRDLNGTALFIRAYAYHNLAQVFSFIYDESVAPGTDIYGIPLRPTPNINDPVERATVRQTYETIISDLKQAIPMLADNIPTRYLNRPSKATANALLARVYLSMRKYDSALHYAEKSLSLYPVLFHFDTTASLVNNAEILYQSKLLSTTSVLKAAVVPFCIVDSTLYGSYDLNDKRRSAYFINTANGPIARSTYAPGIFLFSGLATDEMYLIKAECLARAGSFTAAMDVLNTLLEKRFTKGTFVPLMAINQQDAIDKILTERRKELVFRGLRWTDLRRLNKEGANITVMRKLGSAEYTLSPNSPKYVLPLPPDVELTPTPRN